MSLLVECGWAACRAAAVSAAALTAGFALRGALAAAPGRVRPLLWALLLAPYLTPVALVGYAYADLSLSFSPLPWRDLLYTALLWMKLTPLAALALYFSPSSLSPEAIHCRRLTERGRGPTQRLSDLNFQLRGMARAAAVALALVFLLAFAEFDLASLLCVDSWTVKLFDAHVGRLDLGDSLWLVLAPASVELAVVATLLTLLAKTRNGGALTEPGRTKRSVLGWTPAAIFMAVAAATITVLPLAIALRGTVKGLSSLLGDFPLGREIAASLFFAGLTAFCTYALAGYLLRRRRVFALAAVLSAPGMLGALVLSLLLVRVCQTALRPVYDTPFPLLLALALLFLPFALLLRLLLKLYRPGEPLRAAELLCDSPHDAVCRRGERLAVYYGTRGRFWAIFLLFCWAYFDLTASSILAPTKLSPLSVLLYNQIHYGRSYTLSAMLCVALAVPLLALALAGGARALMSKARLHV